jgi:hypothetical protein
MLIAIGTLGLANKEHLKFLQKYGELEEETEKQKKFKLEVKYYRRASEYRRKHQRTKTAVDLLPRNFLVSFISEYDSFLGKLLREIFFICPEILQGSDKTMTFSELTLLNSMEDAREYIVEKEVESVLRKSHSDQFSWIENTLKLVLRKGLYSWPCFIEITERRNLFVHADGAVSNQYIKVCKQYGVKLNNDLKPGDRLDVSHEYLDKAFQCLYEIGVKLTHVLWRKLKPDDIGRADLSLIDITYELLADEQYEMAKTLLDFGTETLKKHHSDINRRILVINRAQAYKWAGDEKTSASILEREDWSACGDNFKICVAVLKNDFENAIQLMSKIGSSGSIKEHEYLDWPVFRSFREQPDFPNTFKATFGHLPEKIEEIDIGSETEDEVEPEPESTVH